MMVDGYIAAVTDNLVNVCAVYQNHWQDSYKKHNYPHLIIWCTDLTLSVHQAICFSVSNIQKVEWA